jgi:hypothetical protein
MAGSWRIQLGVVASSLVVIGSAEAYGGRSGCWPMPAISSNHSWPAPQYVYPRGVRVIPLENSCEPVPPPPMPPQTKEPPLQKQPALKPPLIDSTRSLSGSANTERCSVGFWNLTGRDVTLTIDGKSFALAKNRKITVTLARQFSWRTDNGPQQIERVPASQSTYDVAVRE